MKSICALKNNGNLGCWNPINQAFDELIPKQSKDIKVVDTNWYKNCVINNSNAMKCWGYN